MRKIIITTNTFVYIIELFKNPYESKRLFYHTQTKYLVILQIKFIEFDNAFFLFGYFN